MQRTTVPVECLRAAGFDAEVETVATAVAEYLDDGVGKNVAVVSEPFAGRDALVAYVESLLDGGGVTVELDATAMEDGGPALPDDGALVVTDCHYLFGRRIDGFDAIEAFLDRIALSETLVVTTWNKYAWSYLDAVCDVGDSFPVRVKIPRLDADEIRTVVEDRKGPDLPTFVDAGQAGRVKTVVFDRYPIRVSADRTVEVPYPKPNPAWVASWSVRGSEESVEAVVFEKLRRVSNGNPGVALAAWKRSVEDGEIAPGYVTAPETDLELDDDEAFVLWTLVSKETVGVDVLESLHPDRAVEADLQRLVERGLVTVDGGTASIVPATLHLATAALERRQLLW